MCLVAFIVSDSFLWTVVHQAPNPWDFPAYTGVGCHFPSLRVLPDPGIELLSPALQADFNELLHHSPKNKIYSPNISNNGHTRFSFLIRPVAPNERGKIIS